MATKSLKLGDQAINFSLPGVDGNTYSLDRFRDKEIVIVLFMCNHCPYVKATIHRIIALQEEFKNKGIALVGINPNDPKNYPEDSFDNMKIIATEKKYNFPYLLDETQEIAGAYDAACTPEFFLFDKDRKLRYHGRLDDNWKEPSKVTRRDLAEAIKEVLDGKEVTKPEILAIGCSIKWKS